MRPWESLRPTRPPGGREWPEPTRTRAARQVRQSAGAPTQVQSSQIGESVPRVRNFIKQRTLRRPAAPLRRRFDRAHPRAGGRTRRRPRPPPALALLTELDFAAQLLALGIDKALRAASRYSASTTASVADPYSPASTLRLISSSRSRGSATRITRSQSDEPQIQACGGKGQAWLSFAGSIMPLASRDPPEPIAEGPVRWRALHTPLPQHTSIA